ncbi:MAG: PilZ domain-containing protein [Candidatus Omnitrophica bacterium]|nr:PilZ domain-containing protein [Candidatus Omnitrophota bacterium]
MMWDGFDKRKFPRLNLQCEILIQSDKEAQPLKTITENVGKGGVAVILDRPLERFSRCHIRLELDPSVSKMEGDGRVVWAVPTSEGRGAKKRFDIGIEFTNLDPVEQEKLRKFLDASIKQS